VLEVIVSRMRHISAQTQRHIRFLGLSTALANARDLADWLGVDDSGVGLYNFRPRYACNILKDVQYALNTTIIQSKTVSSTA
jgi:replicative superfamily II helicase